MSVIKFRANGVDLEQVSEAAGGVVRVAAASPVVTTLAVELLEGADEGVVIEEMRAAGFEAIGDDDDCPLIVIGDDGQPYRVTVSGGDVVAVRA